MYTQNVDNSINNKIACLEKVAGIRDMARIRSPYPMFRLPFVFNYKILLCRVIDQK